MDLCSVAGEINALFLSSHPCLVSMCRSNFQLPSHAFYCWGFFSRRQRLLWHSESTLPPLWHIGNAENLKTPRNSSESMTVQWQRKLVEVECPTSLPFRRDNSESGVIDPAPSFTSSIKLKWLIDNAHFAGSFSGFTSLLLYWYSPYLQSKLLRSRCLSLVVILKEFHLDIALFGIQLGWSFLFLPGFVIVYGRLC